MIYTEDYTVTLESLKCGECGTCFAIDKTVLDEKRAIGGSFYCPIGHCRTFGQTELKRLRDEVAKKTAQIDQAKAEAERQRKYRFEEEEAHRGTVKRLNATKGVVTRYKRRITAGACVCCSRKFKDLERHMKNAHSDFDPDKHIEAVVAKS